MMRKRTWSRGAPTDQEGGEVIFDMDTLAERMAACRALTDVRDIMDETIRRLGFDQFNVIGLAGFPLDPDTGLPPYVTTVDPRWVSHYLANDYFFKDPALARCLTTTVPVAPEHLPPEEQTPVAREVLCAAADHNMQHFLCHPVHGPGGTLSALSVFCHTGAQGFIEARRNVPALMATAALLHETMSRLAGHRCPEAGLTERERQCLLWAGQGKSTWDISVILSVSERTVKFHLHNAMRKLGTSSRTHAVIRATSLGLIKV